MTKIGRWCGRGREQQAPGWKRRARPGVRREIEVDGGRSTVEVRRVGRRTVQTPWGPRPLCRTVTRFAKHPEPVAHLRPLPDAEALHRRRRPPVDTFVPVVHKGPRTGWHPKEI